MILTIMPQRLGRTGGSSCPSLTTRVNHFGVIAGYFRLTHSFQLSNLSHILKKETRFVTGSRCFDLREGIVNQFIELRVDAIERGAERERQNGVVAGEHRHGGAKDARLQPAE